MKMKNKCAALLKILLIFLFFASCSEKNSIEKIKQTGELKVLTRNNAHCYYTYRDNPFGFEYDLARAFSDHLGVVLNVVTPTWEGLTTALFSGKGNLVAASVTISESREQRLNFSDEYLTVQQKIILHKNNNQIERLEDLDGKTIHVRQGTSYEERLKELQAQGSSLIIKLHENTPTEEFIRMVSEKEIEATVADSNIALLNRRYYPDVRIAFPIEEKQSLGWIVKDGDTALLNEINIFFREIKENGTFARIYEKYYANVEIFDYVDLKKFHARLKTRLPRYEKIIRMTSKKYGFDWRLIAAVIYQESHFDPLATSYTGVRGLMQLTQSTAKQMGVENRLDPEQSIRGGVKYLSRLYKKYDEAEKSDRLLIALASYNVGRGHILDAQKIAKEKNLDPNVWSDLEQILPLLSYPEYYKKTAYGYCRGTEPVRYINRILTYYDILKKEAVSKNSENLTHCLPGTLSKM